MRKTQLVLALAAVGFAGSAFATNGYFAHGYGMSSKGMGGVGIAYAQDTLAAASNPAGMVYVGNRMDIGVDIFVPDRGFTYGGGSLDGNGSGAMETWFPIPEFGYNRMIGSDMSVGVSVYGNGGMNTTYGDNDHPFNFFPYGAADPNGDGIIDGTPTTVGIDLMQLFIAPTVAYKVNPQLSIGASLNLVAESFSSKGLTAFGQPNNGKDYAYGVGVRLGAMYQVNNAVTLGATYQTKTNMSKLKDYAAMFPNGGDFDIPATYGVGIAVKANDKVDVALDLVRIDYAGVDVTGNSALYSLFATNQHGFGWKDQNVIKLGVAYKHSNDLTLRAGINYGKQPINVATVFNANDITSDLNTLAPGVVETHLTLGFTKSLSADSSITGAYMHAFNKKVDGFGDFLGPSTLEMSQDSFGLSYNKKF